MLRKKKLLATCLAATFGMSVHGAAQAALIISGGSGGSIPNSNQEPNEVFGEETAQPERGYGANLFFDGFTRLQFTFVGEEAGYNNEFQVDNNTVFTNNNSSFGDSQIFEFGSGPADGFVDGPIPFSFVDNENPLSSVSNGSNPDDLNGNAGAMNFFVTGPSADTENNSFSGDFTGTFLALDDNGADNDDNHDDMGIQVRVLEGPAQIPVPSTLALLGAGLIGLGVLGRKRT